MEESGKYVGFCSLGLSCQPIENVQLRNHFRMHPEMTGVLVSKISPLSDAYKVLKKDDIILAFDGVPVANDGTGSHLLFLNCNKTILCGCCSCRTKNDILLTRFNANVEILITINDIKIEINCQLLVTMPIHVCETITMYDRLLQTKLSPTYQVTLRSLDNSDDLSERFSFFWQSGGFFVYQIFVFPLCS